MIDGRTFTQDEIDHLKYTMIISKDLAETNQLGVGSMVNMDRLVYNDFNHIVKKQAHTSEVISDKVMNDQIVDIELVPELVASNIARAGYETIVTADDMLSAYETPFNSQIILLFYAVWISTILVSTVVPMWYINRLNPKKILM